VRSSHGEGLERDYELRSRGPATLGVEALDSIISLKGEENVVHTPPKKLEKLIT
jgi:hypothetical protein